MTLYEISSEGQDDLFEIWQRIAQDSVDLANRIEGEFYSLFEVLGTHAKTRPHPKRSDHAAGIVFPLYSFLVVYQPGSKPLRIMAVVRGSRNLKRILKGRVG